jgi:hypothetical protein
LQKLLLLTVAQQFVDLPISPSARVKAARR